MEKRQSRTAMIFSILFVLILVLTVGSFFFGLKSGISITESRYAAAADASAKEANATPASQQDFIIFYNTVFSPFREFQSEWSTASEELDRGELAKPESSFKSLSEKANAAYDQAGSVSLQNLKQIGVSQTAYLRSLKLFGEAASEIADNPKKLKGAELAASIADNANYKAAVKQQLKAQQLFYDGMLQWAASVDNNIPSSYTYNSTMKLTEWSKLSLILKSKLMADLLQSQNQLTDYMPQDLAARIDGLINSGQADKRKLTTIGAVVDLLLGTDSVRSDDYASSHLYSNETVPNLPIF